jgi:hypothetical protein
VIGGGWEGGESKDAREGRREERRRTLAILIHAGSSNRGSSDPPERYRTQDVMYAFMEFIVRRRTRVALIWGSEIWSWEVT